MRTVTMVVFGLVVLLVFGTSAVAQAPSNKLEGSWGLIKQTLIYTDTTIYRDNLPPSIKTLNSTHFAWGYQSDDGQDVLAGGGRYTLKADSIYTEHIEYHTTPPLVGMAIQFRARVEGDSLWYHTGTIGDFVLREVWRRIR